MSALTVAAACGFFFGPPASFDALPLPAGAVVLERPWTQVRDICRDVPKKHGSILYGCTSPDNRTAYVPTWKTWPGTRVCWAETRRHEEAHLKGWKHP